MWGFFPFVQENKKKMYPTERLRNRKWFFFSVLKCVLNEILRQNSVRDG